MGDDEIVDLVRLLGRSIARSVSGSNGSTLTRVACQTREPGHGGELGRGGEPTAPMADAGTVRGRGREELATVAGLTVSLQMCLAGSGEA